MALTTTYLNSAVSATPSGPANTLVLAAYTAPSVGAIGAMKMLQFATGEYCLITDDSNSPTLQVVRGWYGSRVIAHALYEGVQYGLSNDASWQAAPPTTPQLAPVTAIATQEITATGATGTTAGVVLSYPTGFLNATGASGTGINLPVATVGASYVIKNNGTGVIKIYSVGGTINGTTGTTAVSLTATGNLMAWAECATAGAWQVFGNT